jgi:hypothetical protein
MGLDNDLYTLLNTSWVVATIAKPTFHLNPDKPRAQTRHLFIQTQLEGSFGTAVHDNSLSDKVQPFELTFYEGSEDDVIKVLKVAKKLLMEASVTNGKYHISSSNIIEQNQIKYGILKGELHKFIASDDY